MQVEIWSDVACPWCAVGKRRFEVALAGFEHREQVELRWRSFELDPEAPAVNDGDYAERLAAKYRTSRVEAQAMSDRMTATAAEDGWAFRFDRIRPGNTFDAHRLLHLAHERGMQDTVKEHLLSAYLEQGRAIGDQQVLTRVAVAAGLDADDVTAVLASHRYADEVRADEHQAHQLGISGVPFFVLDRRYAVSGAQPAKIFRQALDRAWDDHHSLAMVGTDHTHTNGHTCTDASCAI